MKKHYFATALLCTAGTLSITAQNNEIPINFPDNNLKKALLNISSPPKNIDINNDNEISLQEAQNVTFLDLSNAEITNLKGIEHFKNLTKLYCYQNNLTSIDLSKNDKLTELNCHTNLLENINLSKSTLLEKLTCYNNKLTDLNISKNSSLTEINCNNNQLKSLNISKNKKLSFLDCTANELTDLDTSNNTQLTNLQCSYNELLTLDTSKNIHLTELDCGPNQLSTLDLSNNIALTELDCGSNQLTSLNISKNKNLSYLDCNNNSLETLDVSKHSMLSYLDCDNNNLATLNVSKNKALTKLLCYSNLLTTLDVSNNTALIELDCGPNQLSTLDLSKNTNLAILGCGYNKLTTLDVRNCNLNRLSATSNPDLEYIYASGQNFTNDRFGGLHFYVDGKSLKYVCVDNSFLEDIKNTLPDVTVSTECTYNPKDENYSINGTTYFNTTGTCTKTDTTIPYVKFSIVNDSTSTYFFSDKNGYFNIPFTKGKHTIHPKPHNNLISNPDSYEVNFINDSTSITKDFCIAPKNNFNDLAIVITPNESSANSKITYTITYYNKGTNKQSGNIFLNYESDKQKYIASSDNGYRVSREKIFWNFKDLLPFETKTLSVTFKLKETNNNDLKLHNFLTYKANISNNNDNTPTDNNFTLKYDSKNELPNSSITCLNGNTITSKQIGKYLYYLIRFNHNNETKNNHIVIKNNIDSKVHNIESLTPLDGSHPYTTTIENNNIVKFTFKDINTPLNNKNNNAYVLYKVKSKNTLKVGDIITNKATIHFNNNEIKATNEASIKVIKESIKKPKFNDYFILSPNPTRGWLRLTAKRNDIRIRQIVIYNKWGRIVGIFSGYSKSFNVGYLYANNYLLKLYTNKGTLSTMFTKIN